MHTISLIMSHLLHLAASERAVLYESVNYPSMGPLTHQYTRLPGLVLCTLSMCLLVRLAARDGRRGFEHEGGGDDARRQSAAGHAPLRLLQSAGLRDAALPGPECRTSPAAAAFADAPPVRLYAEAYEDRSAPWPQQFAAQNLGVSGSPPGDLARQSHASDCSRLPVCVLLSGVSPARRLGLGASDAPHGRRSPLQPNADPVASAPGASLAVVGLRRRLLVGPAGRFILWGD